MSSFNESLNATKTLIDIKKDMLSKYVFSPNVDEVGMSYAIAYNENAIKTKVSDKGEMESRIHFYLIISLLSTNVNSKEQTELFTSRQEFGFNNQLIALHNCQIIHHMIKVGFEDFNKYYGNHKDRLAILTKVIAPEFEEVLPVIQHHFSDYL